MEASQGWLVGLAKWWEEGNMKRWSNKILDQINKFVKISKKFISMENTKEVKSLSIVLK